MRHELGDRLENLIYDAALAALAPGEAPPAKKPDHRAKFSAFDAGTGVATFDLDPCDPVTHEPMIALAVVYVPVGHALPNDAAGFLALPDADYPKSSVSLDASQYGTKVSVPKPDNLKTGTPYLGQAIHTYAQ